MHGRIRSGPDARWMPFTAEQHSFTADVGRLFYLNASMMFLPVQGLHQYVGDTALMRVKAAGLVTLFNDLCIMAPGALTDFISDDRLAASADGSTMTPMRWSTPLSDYRAFGPHRLASRGEGRYLRQPRP
jgi:hypothetical protein